ncbi:MAG TPA: serine/threonine-protein kinase, partial [Ktedonobacterales bacterium]
HQHGIVHRDVKPSNLLLHPDGRLLLADFGIARPLDQRELPDIALASAAADDAGLTVGGVTLGTPDYMAPEQIRGERVGPAADIYALGVVSYAALTGRSPFGGGPTAQVLGRQLHDPPPPLRIARPDAPPRLEEVIFWGLAKDAADRPASAGAFAQALRAGARGTAGGALWKRAAGAGASLATFRSGSGALAAPPAARAGLAPPGDATLWDAAYHGPQSRRQFSDSWAAQSAAGGTGATAWPSARTGAGRPRQPGIPAALLAAIGVALVVLIIMGVVVASALGGSLGQLLNGTSPSGGVSAVAPHPTATMTATPAPTPTATPPANWLTATPDSLDLTCKSPKKTQYVRLSNQGPGSVQWTAQLTDGSSGVKLSATHGTLNVGKSTSISVTNTSLVENHQGEIDFTPQSDGAGAPAPVTYTTQACLIPQG